MKYRFDTTVTEDQAGDYILRWVEKFGNMQCKLLGKPWLAAPSEDDR